MKRYVVLLLVVAVMLFAGCTGGKAPVLKIATNAEYPPFEYKEKGEFMGVDMELARLVAEKMGMEYELIDMDFDALIPSLGANKIDMAFSAITITEERAAQIDFSIPYYTANQAIIALNAKDVQITDEKDLAKYVIGVQNGTTGQIYIDNNLIEKGIMKKKNLKKYATNIEAITDMMNKNVDLVIIDDSAAKGYEKLKPIKTIFVINTDENYGIALQKDSPLKEKVDAAVKEILESDEWVKIIQKYM